MAGRRTPDNDQRSRWTRLDACRASRPAPPPGPRGRPPLIEVPLPFPCSNTDYEMRMAQAIRRAVAEGFTHVAFGDLFLEDVRQYRETRLAGSGLDPIFPLWQRQTAALSRRIVAEGLRAKLTCVDPRHLDRAFAGVD